MRFTIGAFVFHFAAGYVIWSFPSLTSYFGGDALTYSQGAVSLSQHWANLGPMPHLPPGKGGFFYMLAGLYTVFGIHASAGLAVDAAFGAAIIPLLADATHRIFGEEAEHYIPLLALLMPGFMIWASQLLRESGIYLGIAMTVNAATRLTRRVSPGAVAAATLGTVFIFTWRSSVGVLTGGGLIIALILQRRVKHSVATIVMLTVAAVLVLGFGIGHSGLTVITNASLQELNGIRQASATTAASGFLANSDISTASHTLAYLPIGVPLFLFGPAPWEIHSLRQVLAGPDAFVWWALIPSLWRGVAEARKRIGKGVLLFSLPAFANAVGLSLLIANFGTAVRERMQVTVLLLPLVAVGLAVRRRTRRPLEIPLAELGMDEVSVPDTMR